MNEQGSNASKPLISVLLPVYNGEKFLGEAISSILCQTLNDFELIIINDGSTDRTLEVIEQYKDSRIHLISRENRGLIETLNEGIDIASGEWLARMDADDIALPNRFERQLEWLQKSMSDVCGSWVKRFGEGDERIVRLRETDKEIKTELLFCSPFAHPSVIIRTAKIRQLKYDKSCEKAEDYDLWVRAAECGLKMTNVPEVLLLYRVHLEQVSVEHEALQQEKGQEVRHRYWSFILNSKEDSCEYLEAALSIFIPPRLDVDMDSVEALFYALMQSSDDVSKEIVFSHIGRLYILAAADCPNIVARWYMLNRVLGMKSILSTPAKLLLFRIFRIRENDFIYTFIRKLYLWKSRIFNG